MVITSIAKSKYEEDVHHGNHTSVFGSFWKNGQWGYACCHSFEKNSYCVGEKGKHIQSDILKEAVEEKDGVYHWIPGNLSECMLKKIPKYEEDFKKRPDIESPDFKS